MSSEKVIWSRGLFLQPQHFQQYDRHIATQLEARVEALVPYSWGFTHLVIDSAGLRAGRLGLIEARGVFPDGTPFSIPDRDPPPPPLRIGVDGEGEYVLGLALQKPAGVASTDSEGRATQNPRYDLLDRSVADANSDEGQALVQVGTLRLLIMRSDADLGSFTTLSMVRVQGATPDGQLRVDSEFMPTCMAVSASERLHRALDELATAVLHRVHAISARLSGPRRRGTADVGDFIYLQTLNRHQPLLAHLARLPVLHPERLFGSLLALVGDLACFDGSGSVASKACVAYDHLRPDRSFLPLLSQIRALLAWEPEHRAVSLELLIRKHGYRVALIADASLPRSSEFVLAVSASIPPAQLLTMFPNEVKVASLNRIQEIVSYSLPAIALHPLPTAPRQIPFHTGYSYFRLDKSAVDHWSEIEAEGGLSMHVPDKYPDLVLELWAIRG